MARVKRGVTSHRKHKKVLSLTKGYRGSRSTLIKTAHEALLHADSYAFHGRKLRKRNIRRLWITRISNALQEKGHSYSQFINKLKVAKIDLDRKVLSDIVLNDPKTFDDIVTKAFGK